MTYSLRGLLVLGCSLGCAAPALAAVTLIDGTGLHFYIQDDVTYSTTSSASGAAQEASYTQAVQSTTTSGAATTVVLSDAFDGYNALHVNDYSYNNNGPATSECGGQGLRFNPQTIGDLTVHRRVFVSNTDSFARWMTYITNNGAADATVTANVFGNLGSDGSTVVLGTGSGDLTGDTSDHWIATGGDASDPRLGHVISNAFGRVGPSEVDLGRAGITDWTYRFTVPAGGTAILINYVTGQPTNQAALDKAAAIVDLGAAYTECISPEDWQAVVNFGFDCPAAEGECVVNGYNPETGACEALPANDGGTCDDGDACTLNDVCGAGVCSGEADPECEGGDDTAGGDDTGLGGDKDCGCASTPAPEGAAAGLLLLGLAALRRRRA